MKPPLDTVPLIKLVDDKLIELLRSLSPGDWQRQTIAKQWVVKDVVTHLLDTSLRSISMHRDKWMPPPDQAINSYEDLVAFLNRLNADWVKATRRLSPQILIDWIEYANREAYLVFENLDPFAPAMFPVSWAGEELSQNWFDLAREYTERWHHQQQIREAIGDKQLLTKQFYHPLLSTFMYAWPFALKDANAAADTTIKATITGEGGGNWYADNKTGEWKLAKNSNASIAAETIIEGDIAWSVFSKSRRKADIEGKYEIIGDERLGNYLLEMISVMA